MDIKLESIDSLNLSTRARNALHRKGIHTVGELLETDETVLQDLHQAGQKTIDEIQSKISEILSGGFRTQHAPTILAADINEYNEEWLYSDEGKKAAALFFEKEKITVDIMELLPARSYNLLLLNGVEGFGEIAFLPAEELAAMLSADIKTSEEISQLCRHYVVSLKDKIVKNHIELRTPEITVYDLIHDPEYREKVLLYVKRNDAELKALYFSPKTLKFLQRSDYFHISDIIFKKREDFLGIPYLGSSCINEIFDRINEYIKANEKRLMAYIKGDTEVLWNDVGISEAFLGLYNSEPFAGLSFNDFFERSGIADEVAPERLKKIIGKMIADKKLEYVDYRCYRVYESFFDNIDLCTEIDERDKKIISKRLSGNTYDSIAESLGLSKERVRQMIEKIISKIKHSYTVRTGEMYFDEDYYLYFCENYSFDRKEIGKWLGISDRVFNYLELVSVKRDSKNLSDAHSDAHLSIGLKCRINNYLNKDRIILDGKWTENKRADIEDHMIKKLCATDISFDEFVEKYNEKLRSEKIPFDENIYITEAAANTRKNKLSESRIVLWKQNSIMRYYDIDSRDYSELLDALDLGSYENIELSTAKFFENYSEIMAKYDVHDHYELHNLLRKIIHEGEYSELKFGKMPIIKFGEFDRAEAAREMIVSSGRLTYDEFVEKMHFEYGFDSGALPYKEIRSYYYQGVYSVPEKKMSVHNMDILKSKLTGDFYFLNEIRNIYAEIIPDADIDEINSFNLKTMGFTVFPNYAVQNYSSLDSYFEALLTREDITDISEYKKRYAYIQQFSSKLMELKRNLSIVEFEPNQIINFRKLEKNGMTKDMARTFCNEIFSSVDDGCYFSIQSLRKSGFVSDMFDYGFDNWFYSNLLISDNRFEFAKMFGNYIFYKGKANISTKSFEESLVYKAGSVDLLDLLSEMVEIYGCKINDKLDIIYKLNDSYVYYDRILERFYADKELYYREIEGVQR